MKMYKWKQKLLYTLVVSCAAFVTVSLYGLQKTYKGEVGLIFSRYIYDIGYSKEEFQTDQDDILTQIQKAAKLIHKAKLHARGTKTSDYLRHAKPLVNEILKDLNISTSSLYNRTVKEPRHVCPDKFMGGYFGWPQYHKGYETMNCSHNVPISKLVTIVKIFRCEKDDALNVISDADKFLTSVDETFKNIPVIVSTNFYSMFNQLQKRHPRVTTLFSKDESEGYTYNEMISKIRTPYVLIARGIEFFTDDSRLERLIKEIESLDVTVAGGSFRYENGHWKKGCFQTMYRNFTLNFKEGYDESIHECVFCDYMQGPFVAKTDFLRQILFEDLNENNGMYEDFFLRLFKNRKECVVCPDSMFHTVEYTIPQKKWDKFLSKWNLFTVETTEGIAIQNDCKENAKFGPSQAMHLCTYREMADALKIVMRACEESGALCELQEGSALAAVKMGKGIPWDNDFDLRFVSNNCSQCRNLAKALTKNGIRIGDFVTPCCTKKLKLGEINYVSIFYKHVGGDLSGHPVLDVPIQLKEGIEPTKILFDGQWMNVPGNPAQVMRHRYGPEIFHHAEHWRYTGGKNMDPRQDHVTNMFLPCNDPGSHDCLDRYNADGNIQLNVMLP